MDSIGNLRSNTSTYFLRKRKKSVIMLRILQRRSSLTLKLRMTGFSLKNNLMMRYIKPLRRADLLRKTLMIFRT